MDEEHAEYSTRSAVQHRTFYDFYSKICKQRNTAIIDRELR